MQSLATIAGKKGPIKTTSVASSVTAVAITDGSSPTGGWMMSNLGTGDVVIGGSDVTATKGLLLKAGSAIFIDTMTSDDWYGILPTGSTAINVCSIPLHGETTSIQKGQMG